MTSSTLLVAPSNKTVKAPRNPRATAAVSEQQIDRIREYFRKVLCSRVDVAQDQLAFREPFRVANPPKKRTKLGVACDQNRTPLVPPSGVLPGVTEIRADEICPYLRLEFSAYGPQAYSAPIRIFTRVLKAQKTQNAHTNEAVQGAWDR